MGRITAGRGVSKIKSAGVITAPVKTVAVPPAPKVPTTGGILRAEPYAGKTENIRYRAKLLSSLIKENISPPSGYNKTAMEKWYNESKDKAWASKSYGGLYKNLTDPQAYYFITERLDSGSYAQKGMHQLLADYGEWGTATYKPISELDWRALGKKAGDYAHRRTSQAIGMSTKAGGMALAAARKRKVAVSKAARGVTKVTPSIKAELPPDAYYYKGKIYSHAKRTGGIPIVGISVSKMTPSQRSAYDVYRKAGAGEKEASQMVAALARGLSLDTYKGTQRNVTAVKTHTGEYIVIPRGEYKSYGKLTGEAQFDKAIKLGIIPAGSKYMPTTKYMTPELPDIPTGKWSYVDPAFLAKHYDIKGKFYLKTEVDPLLKTPQMRASFMKGGAEALSIVTASEIAKLKPYKIPALYPAAEYPEYDLIAAVKGGISLETLKMLFDPTVVEEASKKAKFVPAKAEEIPRASLGWFDKIKGFFGLTPEGIEEAKVTYLTTPPMPEAKEKVKKLFSREMLSILVPTISKQPVKPEGASIKEVFKAMVEKEKARISLETAELALAMAYCAPQVRAKIGEFAEPLPVGIEQAVKFGGSLFLGAASAPIYLAIMTGHLIKATWAPDKIGALKDLGKGMADFFISIPAMVASEPALATGELTGLFIVGPRGALKTVKSVGARGVPSYIPIRGMGIEYTVVKIPVKILNKKAVVAAVNEGIARAMKSKSGTAIVKIGDGSLKLKIRPTPMSEVVGPALYHATPALTKTLKKGKVTGTLYTSPHLAVRFADSSSTGQPQVNPAILMIFTKDGKVKWSPTTNLYKGAKEMETVYRTAKLEPVKSLWSRLTFGKAGDFITVHRGQIIPIYRFREPGAVVPRMNLADLVAIRIRTIAASLTDLVKGKRGFEIIKEPKDTITKRVIREAEKEIKKGKNTTEAYDGAFRREVRRLTERNLPAFERLYRANPERFEQTYREQLEREFREMVRERPPIGRITREESRQIERGIVPRRFRELAERERPRERMIVELRVPREELPPRRIPPERVPPERVPPPRISPPRVPPEKAPPPVPPMIKVAGVERAKIPVGSWTWKSGFGWYYVPPPWDQLKPIWVGRNPPIGAIKTGEKTPQETIQMIGKPRAKVPTSASIDLGIVDVLITESGRKISFTGKGLETIVGHSISEPTTGMSIPAVAAVAVSKIRGESKEALKKLAFGTSIVSLLTETYRKEIPKKFADMALRGKLGKMKAEGIVKEVKATKMTATRQAEVLRMLPDRERAQVKRLLSEEAMGYAPIRGVPKPVWTTSRLRRKKPKTKKAKKIEPSILTVRMT